MNRQLSYFSMTHWRRRHTRAEVVDHHDDRVASVAKLVARAIGLGRELPAGTASRTSAGARADTKLVL